ncbi:MAG: permease prefix domain 1-containing protein [Oscillospiraceae bacterium]|nr:permease prefix domain 1-containing protein [Oscillospiraceae bacterium]
MQTPKIVSDYLEAAVPKGLTESRRKLLTEELESHIYDKAEHYMEIGYSEEESFEKAVAEMGDAEPVSESFLKLYKENHAVNILIMVLLLGINAVASYYNLGGNMVESMPDPNFMIVMLSLGYFSATVLLMKYAYGRKQTNKLAAVGASMLLVSIPSFFIGTVFVPGGYAVTENLLFLLEKLIGTDCINRFENHFTIPYILFTLGMPVVLSVISFFLSLKSACYESEKRFRLPSVGLKAAAVILVLFTFANAVIYPFAREYQYDRILSDPYEISQKESEQRTLYEIYSKINKGDSRDIVEPLFEKAEMLASDDLLDKLEREYTDYVRNMVEKRINKQLQGKRNAKIYFFITDDKYSYFQEPPQNFILVEFDKHSKVIGKEISVEPIADGTDPDGLAFYCERLKPGMSKQEAADILSSPACEKVFEAIYYKGDTVTEVQSYFAQEEKYNRTVFGVPLPQDLGGESLRESFQATLVFENGVLKEPPETKDTDDISAEISEYYSD